MWINFLPASAGVEATTIVHGGWVGFTITVTKPDATTETFGPYESDPSGMWHISYKPATTGTYTVDFAFPGQLVVNTTWGGNNRHNYWYNAWFEASSRQRTFTVQQAPIDAYQEAPIPWGEYWEQPIDAQNREWHVIAGPWLESSYNATGAFNPYTQAPRSAHIVWTKMSYPVAGGLIGGDYGSLEFQRSTGYSLRCIMGGKVYYNGPVTSDGTNQLYCVDLRTGENIWSEPAPISVTMGQILNWRSQQTKQESPYLWSFGSTYRMYDAKSGDLILTFPGAPSAPYPWIKQDSRQLNAPVNPTSVGGGGLGILTEYAGSSGGGTLITYTIGYDVTYEAAPDAQAFPVYSETLLFPQVPTYRGFWITKWNSSKCIAENWRSYETNSSGSVVWMRGGKKLGNNVPWSAGIEWNRTYPLIPGIVGYYGTVQMSEQGPVTPWFPTGGMKGVSGNVIIASNGGNYSAPTNIATWAGFDTTTGDQLWVKEVEIPAGSYYGNPTNLGNGIFTYFNRERMTLTGYYEMTGEELFSVSPCKNDFAMFGDFSGTYAYGNLYATTYDGYIHCLDVNTGTIEWSSVTQSGGLEMPEEAYPPRGITIADGKVYTSTSKSYETEPLYRGHKLYCFDAFTGDQIWNISTQASSAAIVDGYLITTNNYDGQIYCFGKGQTATTVSAPDTVVPRGDRVLIQGTVTDQSPGTEGTPCIADADMSEWMEYLYMDQPCPMDPSGVPVYLTAYAQDGSMIDLGYTISNAYGHFQKEWTPPDEGVYEITATMDTTDSYFASYDATALLVGPPTAPAVPIEPEPTEAPFITTEIAIIAAVAIAVVIGIAAYWVLRKRK